MRFPHQTNYTIPNGRTNTISNYQTSQTDVLTLGKEVIRMAAQHTHYAEGKSGELYGYSGTKPPEGTKPLVEADGKTLTPDGLKFCQQRGYPSPMIETLRVIHDQYHAPAVGQAIEAAALNSDLMIEKQNKTKKMSERLRLDWEQQDKAFKASMAAAAKK